MEIFQKFLKQNSKRLDYFMCSVRANVGLNIINENKVISGEIPNNRWLIPVISGHSIDNHSDDFVFYDGGIWYIKTNMKQNISILFFKYFK